ncbi:MAG TPA: hydroxymethylbilane synthase [Candidatus Binataceae bacterium]|nr:hydroxymethylbilane synthase [Candidatus Binataceae bacterium]
MSATLRIGSRPSPLALAQTEMVRATITNLVPGLRSEIVPVRTSGDRITSASLAAIGGKGLFIKELEQALSARTIDIAVHSMKDLPAILDREYRIVTIPEREDPRDVVITRDGRSLRDLGAGARLGTSSARRRFLAIRQNRGLDISPLRGNVDTRLQKVNGGELDATILAMAGLKRLGRDSAVRLSPLDEREFIPAAAQGALAIETMAETPVAGSAEIEAALHTLDFYPSRAETDAERSFLAGIGASCATAVGAKATLHGEMLELRAIVFSPDGARELFSEISCAISPEAEGAASRLGSALAAEMLARGAREILGDG